MEEEYSSRGKTGSSHAPAKSDLISSAKLMADAAKSTLSHDTDKIDKAKVAGAAGDLLGAAKQYGKLEEKSFGKYVGKAETYLHQYHSSHSTSTSSTATHAAVHSGDGTYGHSSDGDGFGGGGSGHSSGGYGEYVKLAQGLLNKKQDHGADSGSGTGTSHSGGAGDYIKLAQGLLHKKDDHGDSGHSSSGGAGDYVKLAQGFLKKH